MEKIFVLSMQRNGTSSVGDFLEKAGYKNKRVGHQLSNKLGWSRHWLNGEFEAILESEEYKRSCVFEDDPFWFPDFYKYLFHKQPDSKFILMDRDSDAWFRSMISHSGGNSLGQTDIHAKIYNREADLEWLKSNVADFDPRRTQGLTLFDKAPHYKRIYEQYNSDVKNFFKNDRDRFFYSKLTDEDKWKKLIAFIGVTDLKTIELLLTSEVHAHKTKTPLTQEYISQKGGK